MKLIILSTFLWCFAKIFLWDVIAVPFFFIFHIIKELPNKNVVYERPYTSNFMSYTTQVIDTTPLLFVALLRDGPTELMLKTRIKETEMIRGIPAAHINLKKTNEEFLDRDDDLFVQRRVPHDELHECVKYGDSPIYEGLKKDKV